MNVKYDGILNKLFMLSYNLYIRLHTCVSMTACLARHLSPSGVPHETLLGEKYEQSSLERDTFLINCIIFTHVVFVNLKENFTHQEHSDLW